MTRPTRIVYLNHVAAISGAEQSLLILLEHLDRDRFEPLLLCPPGPLADRAAALGVDTRPWSGGRLYRGGLARTTTSLARLARASGQLLRLGADADLLHANSAVAALAAVPVARLLGRPLVWHVRDLQWPPGLPRWLAPHTAAALAISRAVAASLTDQGMPAAKVALLPNALDAEAFHPLRDRASVRPELGLADDDQVVIVVGQLVPWKGHAVLLEALAALAPRWPRLKLVVVGSDLFHDHSAYVAELGEQAARLLPGRVVWAGQRSDVADLLRASDLLAMPSLGEPFGRVLLEAMAVGLPVVATAPGGPQDIVAPGVSGLLVPQGDARALAAAVEVVLALPPERRLAMGQAGRELLRRRFSPEAQARALAGVYERVLCDARRRGRCDE